MEMSDLTIRLTLLILPGAIATLVVENLTIESAQWKAFRFILYSIILGFLCYICTQLCYYALACFKFISTCFFLPEKVAFWNAIINKAASISFGEIFFTCFLAIPVGFVISMLINKKVLNKLAMRLKVSSIYGEEDLFIHFMDSKNVQWVWVRDKNQKLTYEGAVRNYSVSNDGMRELVLDDVKVFSSENSSLLYEVPTIYLSLSPNDFMIELPELKRENPTCEKPFN